MYLGDAFDPVLCQVHADMIATLFVNQYFCTVSLEGNFWWSSDAYMKSEKNSKIVSFT